MGSWKMRNSNIEYQNPKQAQMIKIPMTKTVKHYFEF